MFTNDYLLERLARDIAARRVAAAAAARQARQARGSRDTQRSASVPQRLIARLRPAA